MRSVRRGFASLIFLAFAVTLVRLVPLLAHEPLLALANSFDQARYTGCFDLFPDRSPEIRPDQNSPEAPYEFYTFKVNPVPLCYGSSELIVQTAAIAVYRVQSTRGAEVFSVRWIGALRLALLLALVAGFCHAWWRRNRAGAALANAALLPAVFADPANTLYFSTFYAEPSALFAVYALANLAVLWHGEEATLRRRLWLALAAFLLATSKIQHLALPLALAGVALAWTWHTPKQRWQAIAMLAGAALGLGLQLVQLARNDPMMTSIRSFNRADVVFTALLPAVSDPAATLARLGLPVRCGDFRGKPAWQLPDLAERACPGIERIGRSAVVRELLREPIAIARLAELSVAALHPWLPQNLGHVAGRPMGKLPAPFATLSTWLEIWPALRWFVLGTPLLAALVTLRRGDRYAVLCRIVATLELATLGVIVLGDGLADVPKQAHVIFNAALGWSTISLVLGAAHAVDLDQKFAAADIAEQEQTRRLARQTPV